MLAPSGRVGSYYVYADTPYYTVKNGVLFGVLYCTNYHSPSKVTELLPVEFSNTIIEHLMYFKNSLRGALQGCYKITS